MKEILNKTEKMRYTEQRLGVPLEEVLRELYVDDALSVSEIAKYLDCTYETAHKWLKLAGVYSRRLEI